MIKRLALAMSLTAATAFAAPLMAQSNRPWYDPTGTGTRSGQTSRNGSIYNGGQNGQYGVQADGQWHRYGQDRNGNTIYIRERYDSQGNLIQEAATRNWLGQYHVVDSRVVSYARNGNYNQNGRYDRNGGYYGTSGRDRNDRWDQNNGHDNGKHNGRYKDHDKHHDHDD